MQLAARLGLSVPPVQIRYVPDPVYIIERFDRRTEGTETRRLHIIDACQALGFDRTFKYQQATVENLTKCVDICTNRARSRQSILEWVLFNVLVGNGDTHFKNLSFGVHLGGIDLAPFYDLVSTESYRAEPGNDPRWPDVDLSIQIGEAKNFAAVTRDNFCKFADQLGVNPRAASRLVDEFTAAIGPTADALVQEFETLKIPEPAVRAGQLRVLNNIRYTAIREMIGRLR